MLLLYLKSAKNIRRRKNSNETSSSQSWEVRSKRVVKINENKFSKKIFHGFFIRVFCRLLTLLNTLSIIFIFLLTSGRTNEKEKNNDRMRIKNEKNPNKTQNEWQPLFEKTKP